MPVFRTHPALPALGLTWFHIWGVVLIAVLASPRVARAQDLVPGAYAPAPVGFYVLNVVGSASRGEMLFDPALPVEDSRAAIEATSFGLARTLRVMGRSANIGVGVPFVHGHISGLLNGEFEEAWRTGPGDIAARFAVNLYGAPAMTAREASTYRQKSLFGVSLTMTMPTGQYDAAKFVNIGNHRWAFKPELGLSRRWGHWTLEGDVSGVFYTDNTNYLNGGTRSQAPIAALQGHLIYTVRPGLWVAGDANFWRGGRLTVNGVEGSALQQNSRAGLTVAVPVGRQQLRIAYSYGAYTRLGGDFKTLGMSYSYAWAAK